MRGRSNGWRAVLLASALLFTAPATCAQAASTDCLGTAAVALGDAVAIRTVRTAIDAFCPCEDYDGSIDLDRRAYKRCAKDVIATLVTAGALREECRTKAKRFSFKSTCGYASSRGATVCVHDALQTGDVSCSIELPGTACHDVAGVDNATRCPRRASCASSCSRGRRRRTRSRASRPGPDASRRSRRRRPGCSDRGTSRAARSTVK